MKMRCCIIIVFLMLLFPAQSVFSQTYWEPLDIVAGGLDNVNIKDVYFAGNRGWAVGTGGTIISGATASAYTGGWALQTSGVNTDLNAAYFDDEMKGWVVGNSGVILYTDDGGATWNEQNSNTFRNLYDVHFVNGDRGWAVGALGIILETNNGGDTWTQASKEGSISEDLHAVYVFYDNYNYGWALGDSGAIIRWYGDNWKKYDSPTSNDLYAIYFVQSAGGYTGWAVGENGVVLRYSVFQWVKVDSVTTNDLYSINFLDEYHCWAVGEKGTVLYNPERGATIGWELQPWSGNSNLNVVYAVAANDIWALGDNGTFIRSTGKIIPKTEITLKSPSGHISDATPKFEWDCNNKDMASITYTLFIDNDDTPFDGYSISVDRELSHELSPSDPITALAEDKYSWGIKTSAPDNTQSAIMEFTVDLSAPTGPVKINDGAKYTNSLNVTLALEATDVLPGGDPGVGVAEMRLSNDNATWSTPEAFVQTKAWDLSQYGGSSEDGEKTVYVQYKDALGNWTTTPISDTIILDTTPPAGAISINNGAEVTAVTLVELFFSVSDNLSSIQDGIEMKVSNSGSTKDDEWYGPVAYKSSLTWNLTNYGGSRKEGARTVYVRFRDAAGNWMSQSAQDDIQLDLTGPKGTISINDGAEITNSPLVKLTMSVSDESGIQRMQFTNGSGKWSEWETYGAVRENWDITDTQYGGNSNDGIKSVFARFEDKVGNTSETITDQINFKSTVSASFEITAPQVAGKIRNNDIVTVKGKADSGGSLVSASVLDENDNPLNVDTSGIKYDKTSGDITGSFNAGTLTAKSIKLKLTLKDEPGNQEEFFSKNTLAVDNDPPTNGSVTIDQGDLTDSRTIDLTISATDAVKMYVDGDVVGQKTWINYATRMKVQLTAGDGTKAVKLTFQDDMGNQSAPVSDQIMLDAAAPSGTIVINNGDGVTTSFTVSLVISVTDANDVVSYRLSNDNNAWTPSSAWPAGSGSVQIDGWNLKLYGGNILDGLKTVYVEYKDKIGNLGKASDTIQVDTAAPTISPVLVQNGRQALEPVEITAIIKSSRGITTANLYYRRMGTAQYITVAMTPSPTSKDYYNAVIPSSEIMMPGIEYYFSASDPLWTVTNPDKAPEVLNSFTVVDAIAPEIEHDPVTESPVGISPKITARVTDTVELREVNLFHKLTSDRSFTKVGMTTDTGPSEYSASIPAPDHLEVVEYYIEALDSSGNSGKFPKKGEKEPIKISFVDVDPPVIIHTPISDGQEAGDPVNITAEVKDNMEVGKVTLKYKVPDKIETFTAEMKGIIPSYTAEIPGNLVMPGKIEYTITASDTSTQSGDTIVSYSFTVVDTTPPVIVTDTVQSPIKVHTAIPVKAKVTDNVKVKAVMLYYKGVEDVSWKNMTMIPSGDRYSATIPAQERPGEVQFYVEASGLYNDSSSGTVVKIGIIDESAPVIVHSPISGVQEAGIAVSIAATVTDDVEVVDVLLYYRTSGSETFQIISMTESSTKSLYIGKIPASGIVLPGVEYYIRATDEASNKTTHPALNPDTLPHPFTVKDTAPPDIAYDPSGLAKVSITDAIIVRVGAADLTGIKAVTVFYRAEDKTNFSSLACNYVGGDQYTATIPSPLLETTLYYYIQAEDNSGNVATSPAAKPTEQPHSIFVEDPFPPLPPTDLAAASAPDGKILLTWKLSTSPDTSQYNIYTDNGSGSIDYSTIYDTVDSKTSQWESPQLVEAGFKTTTYRFVVRAVDWSGNQEENQTIVSAEADATKPGTVSGLTAFSRSGGRIELRWNRSVSTDVVSYNIYGDNAQSSINYSSALARVSDPQSSWTSNALADGKIYRFVVRSQDKAGNEEKNTGFVSAQSDATPPERVTGLSSSTHKTGVWSNQNQVKVQWAASVDTGTGLAGYSVIWDTFAETLPDDVMEIEKEVGATAVLNGSQYFHIRPVDVAGNWGNASHIGPFLIDTEMPQPPRNLKATSQAGGKIKLDWSASASSDVVEYKVYWDSGNGRGVDYSSPIATIQTLTWTSAGLEDGSTYQFSVRAKDRAGNEEQNVEKAAGVSDSQPPTIVHIPVAGLLEQTIMNVSIEADVTDASGLDLVTLYYRKRGSGAYTDVGMAKATGNIYDADIPSSVFTSAGVDYYIFAGDKAGNTSKNAVQTIAVGAELKIPVYAGRENNILMGDGSSLQFPDGAVTADTELVVTVPKIIPEPQAGLRKQITTREFRLGTALSKSINVTLQYSDSEAAGEDESKLAVYLWDGQTWDFVNTVDPQANEASATIMKLGLFSVIGDYDYPVVSNLKPAIYAEPDSKISAEVQDTGSGIDPQNITVLMNGQSISVPGTALMDSALSIPFPQKLAAGSYSMQLAVRDSVGNQTTVTSEFQVVGKLALRDVFCYPNPFDPARGVTFSYVLTESVENVAIRIFSMDGKLVRKIDSSTSIGKNEILWDCKDELDDLVLSSVFICHIEAEGSGKTETKTIKIAAWK